MRNRVDRPIRWIEAGGIFTPKLQNVTVPPASNIIRIQLILFGRCYNSVTNHSHGEQLHGCGFTDFKAKPQAQSQTALAAD